MPAFYLNLRRGDDDLPNDPEPQEFVSLEAAQAEAVASLVELEEIARRERRAAPNYDGIDILGEDGRLLLRVPMPTRRNDSRRIQKGPLRNSKGTSHKKL
jgi:hypothetical protein